MTASPPQEISSPRSVGSSGSDSETEDGFWAKVTKLASSPIRADQFFTKVDPKCLKERLVKDQDVSLLKDHVRRIQYLVTVLDRFKNIRTPAARPLIHTIAYEKLKYDLFYVKNNNLLFDFLVLVQTFEVVLFGRGVR